MSNPREPLARELIAMACCAPSVHNTQPWSWRILDEATIELYADRRRQLEATDPQGRDLAISCGAALQHLCVAAGAFGLHATAKLLPDPEEPDLLARIDLAPGTTTERDVELLAALENRMTDRRGFTDWEVPLGRLEHLASEGASFGVHVVLLTDRWAVVRTEDLLERARTTQLADPAIAAEQDEWTGRSEPDGVPPQRAQPPRRAGVEPRPDRFSGHRAEPWARDEHADALMVVCTVRDDLRSWLRAGQALSALWIRATRDGLSITPQSHVIEVTTTRRQLRRDVLEGILRPQLVLRVGWQETSRPPMDPTPRRSLDDVLR